MKKVELGHNLALKGDNRKVKKSVSSPAKKKGQSEIKAEICLGGG